MEFGIKGGLRGLRELRIGILAILLGVPGVWGMAEEPTRTASQSQELHIPVLLTTPVDSAGVPLTSVTAADIASIREPAMRWAVELPGQTARFSKDPSVVRFGDRFLMYFSLPPQEVNGRSYGWTTGVAASTDLVQWTLVANILPTQVCDSKGLAAPCAKVLGDRVFLFYQTYGTGAKDAICCAWSEDGLHFTPHPANPIFRPHGEAWTNGRAIDADFLRFGDKWFLYAATRDPAGKIQKIVVATAPVTNTINTANTMDAMDIADTSIANNTINTKGVVNTADTENVMAGAVAFDPITEFGPEAWTQRTDAAILEPELPWETQCIEAPTVMERDGGLVMFYAGGYNNDPQHIGVAWSSDGIEWTRYWEIPLVTNGPADQWNASESGHPGIFEDSEGRTWLFYQGNATHGKDWYLSRVEIAWNSETAKNGGKIPVPRVVE